MKLTLTRSEMLERRRLAGGFEPLRTDCTVEDTAGTDVDALLESQLRQRYLELLDHGDISLLAPVEAVSDTAVEAYADGGSVLTPPASCRRVLSVRLDGWAVDAAVLPESEFVRVAELQRNPYTASTAGTPVAVALGGGRVAAWPGSATALSVRTADDAGPHIYNIDERAIGLLCASDYNIAL